MEPYFALRENAPMLTELLERIALVSVSALAGFFIGCVTGNPPIVRGSDVAQATSAEQQTVQAAPGSVVQIGTHDTTPSPADP